MARHREDQPSLFEKETPSIALGPAQKTELAKLLEALLGEIAAALVDKTAKESSHE